MIGCSATSSDQGRKLVIGAIVPLTGDNASYGENERKGISIALQEIKKRWPMLELDVVYEDTRGEAKTAVLAMQKLKSQGVRYFIDDAMSTVTFALIPFLGPDAIMISTGATNPKLSGSSPYFFRIWNSDAEEGAQAAQLSPKIRPEAKKIAVLYVNNDYGLGLRDLYASEAQESIPDITLRDFSFEPNQTNFRDLAALVRSFNPDLIYLVGYGPQTGLVVKELRSYTISASVLSTVTTEDPKFVERAGNVADGTIYVYPKSPSGSEATSFRDLFAKQYSSDPGILAAHGYDVAMLYAMAFSSGAATPSDVQRWFRTMTPYDGASGLIKFDEKGDIHTPYQLKTVQKSVFVPYEP
jgi:branched-chain amino acid transport system substrate-binding protein